jgi:hypothetical protein
VKRVFSDVESKAESPNLELIESVRCLECGAVYSKPARGGTVVANPGCPDCGYLGWVSVAVSGMRRSAPELRSAS